MDRVADISRFFPKALDMGCGRGHIAKTTTGDIVGSLFQTDMAGGVLVCVILFSMGFSIYEAC